MQKHLKLPVKCWYLIPYVDIFSFLKQEVREGESRRVWQNSTTASTVWHTPHLPWNLNRLNCSLAKRLNKQTRQWNKMYQETSLHTHTLFNMPWYLIHCHTQILYATVAVYKLQVIVFLERGYACLTQGQVYNHLFNLHGTLWKRNSLEECTWTKLHEWPTFDAN